MKRSSTGDKADFDTFMEEGLETSPKAGVANGGWRPTAPTRSSTPTRRRRLRARPGARPRSLPAAHHLPGPRAVLARPVRRAARRGRRPDLVRFTEAEGADRHCEPRRAASRTSGSSTGSRKRSRPEANSRLPAANRRAYPGRARRSAR